MISILQLQYFRQLAKKQHMGKTAEELHISAAALSIMIRKMEEDLGMPLFDRKGHQIILNRYGEEYLRYVEAALSSLEQGRMQVERIWKSQTQKLSISVPHAQIWMDRILGFEAIHPESYIAVYAADVPRYVDMICDNTIDFVLTGTTEIEDKRVECCPINKSGIAVCVVKDHPLAKHDGLYLNELQQEPFIDLSPGLPFRNFCNKLFEQTGAVCNRVTEVDYTMRNRLVENGSGYALIANSESVRRTFHDCAFIPLLDKCAVRTIGIFWKKGRQFTPIMKDFFQYIQSVTPREWDPKPDSLPFLP